MAASSRVPQYRCSQLSIAFRQLCAKFSGLDNAFQFGLQVLEALCQGAHRVNGTALSLQLDQVVGNCIQASCREWTSEEKQNCRSSSWLFWQKDPIVFQVLLGKPIFLWGKGKGKGKGKGGLLQFLLPIGLSKSRRLDVLHIGFMDCYSVHLGHVLQMSDLRCRVVPTITDLS